MFFVILTQNPTFSAASLAPAKLSVDICSQTALFPQPL